MTPHGLQELPQAAKDRASGPGPAVPGQRSRACAGTGNQAEATKKLTISPNPTNHTTDRKAAQSAR